jgi:cell division protein FtsN
MQDRKQNRGPGKGLGERAFAILFIAFVVSLSFFLGYMVGRSGTPANNTTAAEHIAMAKPEKPMPVVPKKTVPPSVSQPKPEPTKEMETSKEEKTTKKEDELKDILLQQPKEKKKSSSHIVKGKKSTGISSVNNKTKRTRTKKTKTYYYSIQVGAFKSKSEALSLEKRLKMKGYSVRIIPPSGKRKYYRVRVGMYKDKASAETMALKLTRTERLKPLVVKEND